MSTSIFIARLIGPVMLVTGLAALMKSRDLRAIGEEFLDSRALMFLGGLITMSAGLAIVLTHNIWTADWRVIVTLFGWLTTIAGAMRIVAPPFLIAGGRAFVRHPTMGLIAGGIWVAIGLLFCFFGYLN